MPIDPQTGIFTPGNPEKKEAKQGMPLHVAINDRDFGKFFKNLMMEIFKSDPHKIKIESFKSRSQMNMDLKRAMVRNVLCEVNFYDKTNQALFDDMVNDIWDSFKPILKRKLLQHGSKFTKTI